MTFSSSFLIKFTRSHLSTYILIRILASISDNNVSVLDNWNILTFFFKYFKNKIQNLMEQNTCNEDQYEQEENNKDECFDKKKS